MLIFMILSLYSVKYNVIMATQIFFTLLLSVDKFFSDSKESFYFDQSKIATWDFLAIIGLYGKFRAIFFAR